MDEPLCFADELLCQPFDVRKMAPLCQTTAGSGPEPSRNPAVSERDGV